jgi:cation:H+ antiporter
MLIINLLFFSVACIVLAISGHLLVKSLVKIAGYYKLTEFVIGFVLMAIMTSLPELFIGVSSAINKIPTLSLGDIIGSNILDLTLVVGTAILIGGTKKIESKIEERDILYVGIIAVLPLILLLDNQLSRIDGIALLMIFLFYVIKIICERKQFKRIITYDVRKKDIPKNLFLFIISLVILFISANFIVKFASFLVVGLGLPLILIGLLIVSIGTSLPELSFETHSLLKGYGEMALGDLLGSVVMNSTLVLGIVSIIYPIEENFSYLVISATFLVITLGLFIILTRTKRRISRREAIILLLVYVIFVIFKLVIKPYNKA